MILLTKEQAQELDSIAINKMGIPGKELMGNAGLAVAEYAQNMVAEIHEPKILIICGKGNNAGDGYKAALDLKLNGIVTVIYNIFDTNIIKRDSLHYYNLCIKENISIINKNELPNQKYDLIIDAILGTGFKGELKDPILQYTKWINNQSSLVLSIDLPSGVNANNGKIAQYAVRADVTVTMGHTKVGMMIQPAQSICGEIIAIDIGFPEIFDDLKGMKYRTSDENLVYEYLKPPSAITYKHKQGKVLILAGSIGMTGAAILASNSAVRSGAGLVTTFAPKSLSSIYESNIIEGLTVTCEDDGCGHFLEQDYNDIEKYFDWADSLLIGPGIGKDESTIKLVKKILSKFEKPLIIDADALNCFINNFRLFNEIKSDFIITPHFGEFSRLIDKNIEDVKENIISEFELFSNNFKGILIAKNAPTYIVTKEEVVVNTTGNQGMATGGTGDVLSGIIASLVAQGIPSKIAAEVGVYIHGKAADAVKDDKGYRGLIASDIIDYLPSVIDTYE